MQFTVATLLLAASGAMALTPRQASSISSSASAAAATIVTTSTVLDTRVRVILRDDTGFKSEVRFELVDGRLSTGVSDAAINGFTTLEVDIGADVDPKLRCAATADDDVQIFATRGANLDDTFSDSTNGEWTFSDADGNPTPAFVSIVRCDTAFVANNRNNAAITK